MISTRKIIIVFFICLLLTGCKPKEIPGKIVFLSARDYETPFNSDIYSVDYKGENLINLTDTEYEDDLYPAWSPDGTKIVYIADPKNMEHDTYRYDEHLMIMDQYGNNKQMLASNMNMYFPTWGTNGYFIMFSTYFNSHHALFKVDKNSDGTWSSAYEACPNFELPMTNYNFKLLRDLTVLYETSNYQIARLYLKDCQSEILDIGGIQYPSIPDPNQKDGVVFSGYEPGGYRLYIMNSINEGTIENLEGSGPAPNSPLWNYDGTSILYLSDSVPGVFNSEVLKIFNLRYGYIDELPCAEMLAYRSDYNPIQRWSAMGEYIVYVGAAPDADSSNTNGEIYIVEISTGKVKNLSNSPNVPEKDPVIQPISRFTYY